MRAAWILPLLFGACAAAEAPVVGHPWEPVGYQGFVESIDQLVGPNAIDCGFHKMIDKKPDDAERSQAYKCVQAALKGKQPFKYGTLRIPTDSYGYEVLARAPQGELWLVTFDRMLDNDESGQQWNQVCSSVRIDPKTLVIHGPHCVEKSRGRLNP